MQTGTTRESEGLTCLEGAHVERNNSRAQAPRVLNVAWATLSMSDMSGVFAELRIQASSGTAYHNICRYLGCWKGSMVAVCGELHRPATKGYRHPPHREAGPRRSLSSEHPGLRA